jgi:hypothetical protein
MKALTHEQVADAEARLRAAGLYKSALKVREAVQEIGFEYADALVNSIPETGIEP